MFPWPRLFLHNPRQISTASSPAQARQISWAGARDVPLACLLRDNYWSNINRQGEGKSSSAGIGEGETGNKTNYSVMQTRAAIVPGVGLGEVNCRGRSRYVTRGGRSFDSKDNGEFYFNLAMTRSLVSWIPVHRLPLSILILVSVTMDGEGSRQTCLD